MSPGSPFGGVDEVLFVLREVQEPTVSWLEVEIAVKKPGTGPPLPIMVAPVKVHVRLGIPAASAGGKGLAPDGVRPTLLEETIQSAGAVAEPGTYPAKS